jgi:hypothetical protein
MGAWGSGIFENDDACDLLEAVSGAGGFPLVRQAINKVLACCNNYLCSYEAQECLAAAEIIVGLNGNFQDRSVYTEEIILRIKKYKTLVSEELLSIAKQAVERVILEPSELLDLWKSSDDFDVWRQSVERLLARL